MEQMSINEIVSQALTDAGYPHILNLGIHNIGVFESVIMDGLDMSSGPITKYTYNFQSGEFTIDTE
jgi:hypothetical protein